MQLEEKMRLVKRNAVELITEEEIRKILSEKKKPVTYCGYEPSGPVHVGHMVTVNKLLDLEKAGFEVVVLMADLHAFLNKKGSLEEIQNHAKEWERAFKALGLKKAKFVLGSSFQRKPEYFEDTYELGKTVTIARALRAMQDIARDIEHATHGQTLYPLMQVADIKHLGVDVAVGGMEQRKIHMLAREEIEKIGYKKPALVHTPLINSLKGPGKKMSSSIPDSMISLSDSEADIKRKISKAFCPEGEVEGNPVLEIVQLIIFPKAKALAIERPEKFGGNISYASYDDLEKDFAEKKLHPADLKNAVAKQLVEILKPVRNAFK